MTFDGFLTLYEEGRDDDGDEDEEGDAILPDVARGRGARAPRGHAGAAFHRAAAALFRGEPGQEARGARHRPALDLRQRSSRCCSDRNYVRLDRKRFIPEDRGRIVTAFLQTTSRATSNTTSPPISRKQLDDISGRQDRLAPGAARILAGLLRRRRRDQGPARQEVLDKLDEELGPHFFPANDNGGKSPRDCPSCANGRLGLKLGKFGAFIGCSNYPECRFTRKLGIVDAEAEPRPAPTRRAEDPRHRSGERQDGHPAQRALRPLRPARRGRGQGEAQARSRCSRA